MVDFLGHLLRHLPGKLLVVWDGLPAHRARLVSEFISAQRGRLTIEWLPGYAPELNPVEYSWGYGKQHQLPNFCPRDFTQLSCHARRALARMHRRPALVIAFWEQANCFLCNYLLQDSIDYYFIVSGELRLRRILEAYTFL